MNEMDRHNAFAGARCVRTISGRTMAEAIRRMKLELGPDAVVFGARTLWERAWWGGRRSKVELVAGLPVERGDAPPQDIGRELLELRAAVERLERRSCTHQSDSDASRQLRTALMQQGLPSALVEGLLEQARRISPADTPRDLRDALLNTLERMLPTSGPVRVLPGRCTRIALIGPTGVGKTTTIAKLAAQLVLIERKRVGLLAADTYRIAAVDQLARYAELIGTSVRVAGSPEEMVRAVSGMSSMDAIFIDTTGRAPRDEIRMDELARLLRAARADEVHLVLSATSETSALFAAIDRFAPMGATRLIFTKLDEAVRTGALLQGVARARLPVSYLTIGQEVPEDIFAPCSRDLARIVLDGSHAPGILRRAGLSGLLRRSA